MIKHRRESEPVARPRGHGHGHGHGAGAGAGAVDAGPRVVRILVVVVGALAAATIGAMLLLWPHGASPGLPLGPGDQPAHLVHATVLSATPENCGQTGGAGSATGGGPRLCGLLKVRVISGANRGEEPTVEVQPEVYSSGVHPGQAVLVSRFTPLPGDTSGSNYAFADFARTTPMVWLGLLFAIVVIGVARLRGFAALVGLGISFLVLTKFVLPALLDGKPALLVGVVGSAAIMFVVVYAAHGISVRTTTALIGTLAGLSVTAGLGTWAVSGFHLTGVSNEDDQYLAAIAGHITLPGLLLCGIVIASLGVLNDVTVTQASAVWELHAVDPGQSRVRLFAAAMRIGRDHIASTAYTLVFAYAGSSLPILLLINISHTPLGSVVTSEPLAEEIARTLVGAIGLVLAVPITTAVAVALAPPPRLTDT